MQRNVHTGLAVCLSVKQYREANESSNFKFIHISDNEKKELRPGNSAARFCFFISPANVLQQLFRVLAKPPFQITDHRLQISAHREVQKDIKWIYSK